MRVTSVEVHPSGSSDVVVLSFRDPTRQNPYNVKGITGLDADEIVPQYYGVSGGSKFYNLTVLKRDIVMLIDLNPIFSQGDSFSELRDAFYKKIASSRTGLIELQFKDGEETLAAVSGFVTKFEASHFTKVPELQVTVSCNDPMLKAPSATVVDLTGLTPGLTVIEDDKSTAPHGLSFEIGFGVDKAAFKIQDTANVDVSFEVTPSGGFLANDILYVSSEINQKHVYLVRSGSTMHLADVVTPGSVWPILFPGENSFTIDDDFGLTWTSITYHPTYWGV